MGRHAGASRLMDYEILKALAVSATVARTQEMLTAEAMQQAKETYDAASAAWKEANSHWQAAHQSLTRYTEDAIRTDAAAEMEEYRTCP